MRHFAAIMMMATVVTTALASEARASGGLSCTSEDRSATFSVQGGVTRGMGGGLYSFDGSIAIHAPGVANDLRKVRFGREHVAQYRLDRKGLDLRLYRERTGRGPHGYVDLAIATLPADDEGGFGGAYVLTVFQMSKDGAQRTISRQGNVFCMAD